MRIEEAARVAEAAALLDDLASADHPTVDAATGEVRLPVSDPRASAEAIRRLDAHRLTVAAVALEQPSLDDVFLTLTGHPAESGDDALASEEAA